MQAELWKAGEESPAAAAALDVALARARQSSLRLIALHGVPGADAEDLLQEALLLFVERHEQVEDPARWIPAVVRILCLRHRRARRRRLARLVEGAILESIADPGRPVGERLAVRDELGRAFALLRERCRHLLSLRYARDLGAHEIAERLGCRTTSVNKIAQRCLADLGERLLEVGRARCRGGVRDSVA